MNLHDLRVLTLDIGVALSAILVLLVDLVLPAARRKLTAPLAALLLTAVLVASFFVDTTGTTAWGAYSGSAGTLFFQRLFLAAGIVGILGGMAHVAKQTRFRQGEYYFLLLCSLAGMTLLPGVRDLILLLISFELMGLPLYVLAAYEKSAGDPQGRGARASEAGIKLYLVGAASTAIALFGLSYLAGVAGGTSFHALQTAHHTRLFALGAVLVLAGIGFKLGVAPFHMWVPDTYEGAPGPFVAFLSAAPKAAAIAALCAVFFTGLGQHQADWAPAMAGLAFLTMFVGSILAIPQKNVRRLLAYSGVAHVGYMLLAFATGTTDGLAMVLFYAVAYVATNVGAFLVAHAVAADSGDDLATGLRGLHKRSPWLAVALLVFLLSLAGIPFVAGFWAKLYVFVAAWKVVGPMRGFMHVLVAVGAVLSVVALFFYMQLARAAYMEDPPDEKPVRVAFGLRVAIVACLVAVVGIGAYPGPLLEASHAAAAKFEAPSPRPIPLTARWLRMNDPSPPRLVRGGFLINGEHVSDGPGMNHHTVLGD